MHVVNANFRNALEDPIEKNQVHGSYMKSVGWSMILIDIYNMILLLMISKTLIEIVYVICKKFGNKHGVSGYWIFLSR